MAAGKDNRNKAGWTNAELDRLGKVPDSVLAHRTGRTIEPTLRQACVNHPLQPA